MKAYGYLRNRPVELDLMLIGKDRHGNDAYLHRPAAEAFLEMENDARVDGVTIHVNSAFRSLAAQQREWDMRQAAIDAGKPYKLVARPGYSTHQGGCSVDADQEPWLKEHAHEYGFVFDVPGEGWHMTHKATLDALLERLRAA